MQEELIGKAMMTWLGVSSALLLQLPAENVFTSFSILFSASLFLKRYETLSNCHRIFCFYDFYDKNCDRMKSGRLTRPPHWGALAQIYVRSQPYGGSDKSNNGHRYDSIPIVNGISASGQLIMPYMPYGKPWLWELRVLLCVSDIQWSVGSVVEHPQRQTRNDHSWNELPAYSLYPWRAWQVLRALQEFWFHHRSLQPRPFPRRNIQQHSTLWSIAHSSPVCCRES